MQPQQGWNEISTPTYEKAEECLKTNYHGAKTMVEALLPLLQLSDSPRIVNVSSLLGLLKVLYMYQLNLFLNIFSITESIVPDKLIINYCIS